MKWVDDAPGSAAEFTDAAQWQSIRRDLAHKQRLVLALEQIKAIAGDGSTIHTIATAAIQNAPQQIGGTDFG